MKKTLIALLVMGLVAGSLAAPAAAKKKKKKKPVPVAVDQTFYLRDLDGCDTSENQLSLTDAPDAGCWYLDSGVLYEAIVQVGLLTAADLGQTWTTMDGTPFKLDPSKPITGEISSASGECVVADPCSPVMLGGGQAVLDVVVTATIDGEPKEVGTYTETFVVTPGSGHTSKIEVPIDPALAGQTVESLSVLTFLHGAAVGHGAIELDDPSSFILVPSFK
jgi:hypothetical protein